MMSLARCPRQLEAALKASPMGRSGRLGLVSTVMTASARQPTLPGQRTGVSDGHFTGKAPEVRLCSVVCTPPTVVPNVCLSPWASESYRAASPCTLRSQLGRPPGDRMRPGRRMRNVELERGSDACRLTAARNLLRRTGVITAGERWSVRGVRSQGSSRLGARCPKSESSCGRLIGLRLTVLSGRPPAAGDQWPLTKDVRVRGGRGRAGAGPRYGGGGGSSARILGYSPVLVDRGVRDDFGWSASGRSQERREARDAYEEVTSSPIVRCSSSAVRTIVSRWDVYVAQMSSEDVEEPATVSRWAIRSASWCAKPVARSRPL
ncbi:hypothetical protein L227DRAFT_109965 [Lentinus tigrinus ALCF2SS1-6]|uniref:Uncharacterized protein n=1 Tax=Lentinus tigrinus ALCF2SS1-6 TaxID=1328759 RepID=A0A5C2RLR3_9APHY|nr:hypothetical protein L227DRAFT_109965 [Lentinus tigrinus ALCF2SS1-6]